MIIAVCLLGKFFIDIDLCFCFSTGYIITGPNNISLPACWISPTYNVSVSKIIGVVADEIRSRCGRSCFFDGDIWVFFCIECKSEQRDNWLRGVDG